MPRSNLLVSTLDRLENPGDLYTSLAGDTRRDLLHAFFQRLIVHVEDDGIRIRPVRTDINEALHDWQANTSATNERASRVSAEGSPFSTIQRDSSSNGLSNSQLVALIDLCSSKYPTGVESENLRRIRDSRAPSLPVDTDTLPDDAQTSREAPMPRRKWKRLNDEARAQVVARYSAGETTTVLATEFGVAKSTIIGILRANNVVVRRQPMTAQQVGEAARLYESGLSLSQVATALDVNRETMRVAIMKAGVEIRPATGAV